MGTAELHPIVFSHLLSFLSSLLPDRGEGGKGVTKNVEKRGKETFFSCLFFFFPCLREEKVFISTFVLLEKGIFKNVGFWFVFLIPMEEDCYGIGHFGQCLSPPALEEKPKPPRLCPENNFSSLVYFYGEAEAAGRISPVLGCPGHLRAGFQRGFGVNFGL